MFYSVVDIFFAEDDFRSNEGDPNPQVPVVVAKSSQIATRIVMEVVPLTVEQAKETLPLSLLPEDNAFSPQYAGNTHLLIYCSMPCGYEVWLHKFQI